MAETVTVTPRSGLDANNDPIADGTPFTLTPLEVAPGNTVVKYDIDGDLDDVEFTVFFPLTVFRTAEAGYERVEDLVKDGYGVRVRDRDCVARVQVWRSQRSGRGGVVVLASSPTGNAT